MPDKIRFVKTECVTMGHEDCKKVLEWTGTQWILTKINHKVYGKTHIETFYH